MNTLQIKGNWNIAKGWLEQKTAQLMDDDLQFAEGKESELLGRIQKRKAQEIAGTVPPPSAGCENGCACHRQPT